MHCTSQVMASHERGMEIPGGVIHCHGKVRQLSRRSHSLSLHCDRTVIALSWTCHALVMDLCADRAYAERVLYARCARAVRALTSL